MSLIEKLKRIPKIPAILFLSASILFGGCATGVKSVGTKYEPTSIERKVTQDIGKETKKIKKFNILDPFLEKSLYKIPVKESLQENEYRIIRERKEIELREIRILEQQVTDPYEVGGRALGGGLLGGLAGLLVGAILSSKPSDDARTDSEENQSSPVVNWTIAGVIIGALYAASTTPERTKTKEVETGKTKTEYLLGKEEKLEFLDSKLIYKDRPAKDINVRISHGSKKGQQKVDDSGSIFIGKQTAEFFGISWSPSKETLKGNMSYFNPLINQIKPNTLEKIKPELEKNISQKNLEFILETIEKPSNLQEEIENDSKKIFLKGYHLSDEAVYKVIREFVDSKINSRIKILEFSVQDIITHVPIDSSNFKIETETPLKSYLAGEFFTGKIKDYAESYIKNYITRDTLIENCDRTVRFNVYTPSRIFLEVTHLNYKFVSGEIFVNDNMKKTVYMLDKGTKIRVEEESKQGGRIE